MSFPLHVKKKGLFNISDSYLQILLPPKSQNMTQLHQIMCGYETCTQAGTYH